MVNGEPDYKKLYEESLRAQRRLEEKYEEKINALQFELNALRRKLFGIKSDNRVSKAGAGQLELFSLGATLEQQQQVCIRLTQDIKQQKADQESKPREPRTSSRMILPEKLEREEVIIDPEEDLSDYRVIGEEITELLVMVPAHFKVKRIIRRKWALKDSSRIDKKGILIAPIPARIVKRGLFDESVLAHLLISKYVDHLPLYRQTKMFEREGINIAPATLTDNTAAACQALKPIYNALKRQTLDNLYLQADETTYKVLKSEKKGTCHTGYLWAYHAPADGLVFFDYQQGRDHTGPAKILADFHGVIQSDGYAVYDKIFKDKETVNQLYCMAHIRRKFDEAATNDMERATYAVNQIAALYALEKEIKEAAVPLSEDQIVNMRRLQATPILNTLKTWMMAQYPKVLPKSPIGKAIAYALSLWENMYYYTLHGHLQIDNNSIENAIRPIALGRKNYLFAGTHEPAQNAAMIYSLFATCKKHMVNPQTWLEDVLRKINDPEYDETYADLMPHRWKEEKTG